MYARPSSTTAGELACTISRRGGRAGDAEPHLAQEYNYDSEVVDPRGYVLKGVPNRAEEFAAGTADYYDLIIGLHADEASRAVAEAGLTRKSVLVPCCNFWSREKLGQDELVAAIEGYYSDNGVAYERVIFPFKGPKNIGIITEP